MSPRPRRREVRFRIGCTEHQRELVAVVSSAVRRAQERPATGMISHWRSGARQVPSGGVTGMRFEYDHLALAILLELGTVYGNLRLADAERLVLDALEQKQAAYCGWRMRA